MIYVFYFLSGVTALIYEIVWARRLGLIFGVDAYGMATVLAVFFLGLAIGALVGDKIVRAVKNPLLLYGFVEVGIGLYAAATPLLFVLLEKLQLFFYRTSAPSFGSFNLFTLLISLVVLILPTALIGSTFPIVAKAVEIKTRKRENVGLLYAVNTLGAAIGVVLTGFWLIYFLGIKGTVWLAAAVNFLIGLAALYLAKSFTSQPGLGKSDSPKLSASSASIGLKTIVFLTGVPALALEILWTRALVLTFGSSTYTFTLVLANFLIGIGLGSLFGRMILKRIDQKRLIGIFIISLVSLGIYVVLSTPFFGNLPLVLINLLDPAKASYLRVIGISSLLSLVILFIPTSLMGMNFVWVLELAGPKVGQTYFLNTIGGVVGSILAGFFLLPFFGIQKGILVSSLAYFVCSLLAGFILVKKRRNFTLGLTFLSITAVIIGFKLPAWDKHVLTSGVTVYFRDYLQDRESVQNRFSRGDILYYKEGLTATIMVRRAPEGFLFLRNNGKTDASTDQDLDDFRLVGHLPVILHPRPQEVLVIGMGSGITAGSVASHPVKQIDVVEIEPAVFTAAGYFGSYNNDILRDQRLNVIRADARFYLRGTDKTYDVITSQPSNLWVRGNASLFTKEFFEMSQARLKDDGLMLQWIPFYAFSEVEFKTALKTFTSAFPYVTVWTPAVSHDVLLIGSKLPQKFDFEKISSNLSLPQVQKDLETTRITSAERLVAHYLFDEKGLKDLVDTSIPIQTDDKPILEFSSAFSLYKNTEGQNLSQILTISGDYSDHVTNMKRLDLSEIKTTKEAVRLILGAKIKTSQNQLVAAADDFEKALKMIPKTATQKELARLYFELARSAFAAGDTAKTVFYFEKSVSSYPNAQAYLNLSILYFQQQRVSKAKEAFAHARELEPTNPRLAEVEKSISTVEK